MVSITVAAAVLRRGMLPTDGLWFDDSWVAAGASLGRLSELLTVGTAHPTFTALLMAIDRVGGGNQAMTMPALVAGTVAPAVLYVVVRWMGSGRPASLLTASVLVVAEIPLLYAGRVKGYVIDVVLVLGLAVVVAWASGRRWRPAGAVAWVLGAWVVAGMSGNMVIATAVAGGLLVLQAHGDRLLRAVAVGVQGLGQLWYLREVDQHVNLDSLDRTIDRVYDSQVDIYANPLRTAEEVLEHLRRIGQLYPGRGAGGWLALVVVVAVGGLLLAAVRGRTPVERTVGRYLLALLVVAFIGGVFGVLPFGGRNELDALSPGGRYNLWLVGPVAVGATVVLDRLVRLARGHRAKQVVAGVAVALSVAIVAEDGFPPGPPARFPGAASAAQDLDRSLGPDDRAVVLGVGTYAYPIESRFPSEVVATPHYEIGFSAVVDDPRFLTVGAWSPVPDAFDQVGDHVAGADRVFVIATMSFVGGHDTVSETLTDAGFERVETRHHQWAFTDVWERRADP